MDDTCAAGGLEVCEGNGAAVGRPVWAGVAGAESAAVDGVRCESDLLGDTELRRMEAWARAELRTTRPTMHEVYKWARTYGPRYMQAATERCAGPTLYQSATARARAWSEHVRWVCGQPTIDSYAIAGEC